jgi:L-ribulose-5-phosphate 3-epimerase
MNRRLFLQALPLSAAAFGRTARLKAAICAYSFRKELADKSLTYEDLIRKCPEWGIDGVDMTVYWFPSTADTFLLPLRRLAYKEGVQIYSIAVRTELTKASAEDRAKEVQSIQNWLDVAEKVGAGHVRVFGGNVPKGLTDDQAAANVVECLKKASDLAAHKGIILGLENHGGITLNADRIVDIIKKVDSPWVQMNLDTGNFRTDAFRQMGMCLPYAANVQVKAEMNDDAGKKIPQDWDRVVKMIASAGYRGYLALEYEAAESAPAAVPRLLAKLRTLCAQA